VPEATVYLCDDLPPATPGLIDDLIRRLPSDRAARCRAYQSRRDQVSCAVSYLLLASALRERRGLTEVGPFAYGPHGKPALADHPGIHFNLSHCPTGIVVVVADQPIGADIEAIRPVDWDVARRVCSGREWYELTCAANPAATFARIWTDRESFVKCRGGSLAEALRCDLPEQGFHRLATPAYHMSVFTDQPDPTWTLVRTRGLSAQRGS